MQNRISYLKSTLYEALNIIREKTGVNIQSWRSIFNYGSSEWNILSNSERSIVLAELKSEHGISLSDAILHYSALNDLQGKSMINNEIQFSLSLIQ